MNRDFSLIDANFARVREGYRVLDEVARFAFRDEHLFSSIKNLRHLVTELERVFPSAALVAARQGGDVGEADSIRSPHRTLYTIIRANCNRITESLRVLEEFARVYAPNDARSFAELRYHTYQAELNLLQFTPHYFLERYLGAGTVYPLTDTITEATWLVEHGARIIQFRDKTCSKEEYAVKAQELCRYVTWKNKAIPEKVLLILNDYVDVAADLPVAGVHLGQGDGSVVRARHLLGTNKIIGRSNHSVEHIEQSIAEGADYVSIGPVFATPTKPDREPVGLSVVSEVARIAGSPLVVIGGIDARNAPEVYATGARNIAVVRSARQFFV